MADGKAQAMILDEPVADYYIKDLGLQDKVKAAGEPVASGLMTLPVQKGDAELLAILDKGIYMVGDAEFEGIYESYVGAGN